MWSKFTQLTLPVRVSLIAVGWLVLISLLHFQVNYEHSARPVVRMGYMPVISNLAAPLLDHASKERGPVRFEALKFASFAEMAEALRNNQIQVAFMIAPLSITLKQQGEDVKIVYIGNRHESTLVTRKDLNIRSLADLAGKTVAVPMRYSGHNLSIQELMEKQGLQGRINVVEMNPPDMAASLASGSLDAYYVGEPFAAQTLLSGDASLLYHVEDVWPKFICNLALVRQQLIEDEPEVVDLLVKGAARSGLWAAKNTAQAAEIAAKYWNQSLDLVNYAFNTPQNRIVFDQFVPQQAEMQYMAELMAEFDLLEDVDISGLVDDSFAKAVDRDGIDSRIESIF